MTISDHFVTESLLPAVIDSTEHFYVLTLSQKKVRLLDCSGSDVQELYFEDFPHGIQVALGEQDQKSELQMHNISSPRGGTTPVFHGQGSAKDRKKGVLLEFLHEISKKVEQGLKGKKLPLVIAAADPLYGLYRSVQSYPFLLMERMRGNPDHWRDKELISRAKEILGTTKQRGICSNLMTHERSSPPHTSAAGNRHRRFSRGRAHEVSF